MDLHLGAGRFDFFLDLGGFFLGDAFLDGLGSPIDQGLGLGKTESGDGSADFLDDGDLVGAGFLEDDVEGGLHLDGSGGGRPTGGAGGRGGDGSGGADAPLGFEGLDEFGNL